MCARPTSGWPDIGHRDEEVSGTVLRVRLAARIASRKRNVQRSWPCAEPSAPIARLAEEPGLAYSTVGRIAQQAGLNRLSHLDPPVAFLRYVYPHPGDLLHLDIKRLGRFVRPGHRVTGIRGQGSRGAGWEYVHVAIDDHSRVNFACYSPARPL